MRVKDPLEDVVPFRIKTYSNMKKRAGLDPRWNSVMQLRGEPAIVHSIDCEGRNDHARWITANGGSAGPSGDDRDIGAKGALITSSKGLLDPPH